MDVNHIFRPNDSIIVPHSFQPNIKSASFQIVTAKDSAHFQLEPYPMQQTNPHDSSAFDWQPRTRLVVGAGCLARVGELAAELGRRALVVTDHLVGLVRTSMPAAAAQKPAPKAAAKPAAKASQAKPAPTKAQ